MEILPLSAYDNPDQVQKLSEEFERIHGLKPEVIFRVPGRVNLIGEHIDYCGYAVHPMAIEQCFLIAAAKSHDSKVHLVNTHVKYDDMVVDISSEAISVEKNAKNWSNYFMCGFKGVVEEMADGKRPSGLKCLFEGTIPPSAGLSSSSALVVASSLLTLWSLDLLNKISRSEIANLCARSERFIGTQGGGMDQAIVMLAQKGTAKLIEFNPLTTTDVKLPPGATFVIANSLAEKNKAADPAYNTRVAETRLGAMVLAKLKGDSGWRSIRKFKQLGSDLSGLLSSTKDLLHAGMYTREELCNLLEMTDEELQSEILTENTSHLSEFKLRDRAMHVFSEALRVYQFKSVCDEVASSPDQSENALKRLGKLMFESHRSCSELYECSHPQLNELVDLSKKFGALGARLTGAGWGGCIVALVPSEQVPTFVLGLVKEYFSKIPAAGGLTKEEYIFPTQPGEGAQIFNCS